MFKKRGGKGKGMSSGTRLVVTVILSAVLIVGGGFLLYYFVFGPQSILAPDIEPTPSFSIVTYDGSTGDILDNDDFDYNLYGLDDDINDWVGSELIESGSSLDKIVSGDLEDYDFYVIQVNGTVEEEFFDDDEGDRTYYARWFQLVPGIENEIQMYQQPSDTNFVVVAHETFDVITNLTASPIVAIDNFTIIAGTNASQDDAWWVQGNNYENEVNDYVSFVLGANDTMALSDISISGTTKTRVNSTAIRFNFNMLGSIPKSFECLWNSETEDLQIDTIELYHGDTLLASLA